VVATTNKGAQLAVAGTYLLIISYLTSLRCWNNCIELCN
jgi:hypothetical protein